MNANDPHLDSVRAVVSESSCFCRGCADVPAARKSAERFSIRQLLDKSRSFRLLQESRFRNCQPRMNANKSAPGFNSRPFAVKRTLSASRETRNQKRETRNQKRGPAAVLWQKRFTVTAVQSHPRDHLIAESDPGRKSAVIRRARSLHWCRCRPRQNQSARRPGA
jgi:hypothetical protein